MSDMLSQHQNWYIQRNLCLGHSKFPTAIEAVIAFFFFFLVYYSNKHYIMVWRLFKASVYLYFCSKIQRLFE